jgi:hypothetical protein
MRRRLLALSMAVMVAGAGCSSGGHHTVAPTTTANSISASPNPDVIPPVITAAYVNAVFVVLNHVQGNATRSLVATTSVNAAVMSDLRSIYNDPLYSREVEIAQQTLAGGLTDFLKPPGDIITTVDTLEFTSPTCIFVSTKSNFRSVVAHPSAPAASEYWRLSLKQPGSDVHHLNPTPWALSFNATYITATSIPNQCAV